MKQISNRIIDTLRQELAKHDKPENKLNYQRFFKEKLDDPIGLKTAVLRKISNICYRCIDFQFGFNGYAKTSVFRLLRNGNLV